LGLHAQLRNLESALHVRQPAFPFRLRDYSASCANGRTGVRPTTTGPSPRTLLGPEHR
jgi:hypothetical protein